LRFGSGTNHNISQVRIAFRLTAFYTSVDWNCWFYFSFRFRFNTTLKSSTLCKHDFICLTT